MRDAELQGTGKDRADCMKKFRAASDRFSSDPGSADRISGDDAEAAAMSWCRPFDDLITLPGGRELVILEEARSWLLATIFRRDSAGFGAINASCGSQRLTRRLYPTEGVMRPKHKEYRQRNHRPSCEHENPVQHRDIVRRIWTQDTRYRRDMPVVVPSLEWPPLLTGPAIPMQVVVPSVS
jgi:hypothetical protein